MKNIKKDAYWFPHYSNTKDEPLIALMRMKLGAEGYGVFIMILEMMRDAQEYKLSSSYEVIAWTLNLPNQDLVKKVIEDFGLFELEDDSVIASKRLTKLMSSYDQTIITSQINGYKSALIKHKEYTKAELKSLTNEEVQKIYQDEFLENSPKTLNPSKDLTKSSKSSFSKESRGDEITKDEKKINCNKVNDDPDLQILFDFFSNKLASDQSRIYEFINDIRNDLSLENFLQRLESFSQSLKGKNIMLNSYDHFIELFLNHQNRNYGK